MFGFIIRQGKGGHSLRQTSFLHGCSISGAADALYTALAAPRVRRARMEAVADSS
ncbi:MULTISPECIES: hypothetical protein [unclassified Paenibacillus]|uniref:hypothetical protein n=1 Tax=unclassified Paenibacillus TaxID=185978 RepID=UPI00020D6E62|nr:MULTISPECIES: hypothetical protein [unclassified Paenibacillus]EGL20058.1 hypothetical protein HMPREF9413_1039 [Paenibacillus sp. HGF7]